MVFNSAQLERIKGVKTENELCDVVDRGDALERLIEEHILLSSSNARLEAEARDYREALEGLAKEYDFMDSCSDDCPYPGTGDAGDCNCPQGKARGLLNIYQALSRHAAPDERQRPTREQAKAVAELIRGHAAQGEKEVKP